MLTLTCCYCSPTHIPTSACTTAISAEVYPDHVAYACDGGRQVGAAALRHQGCPVIVRDCQVFTARTRGGRVDIESGEFYEQNESLFHFYHLRPLQVISIVVGIVC